MKDPILLIGTVLSIFLFFMGIYTHDYFIKHSLPVFENVHYTRQSIRTFIEKPFIYSITLGLIPLSIVVIWKMARVFDAKKRILVAAIIVGCVLLAGIYRYERIRARAQEISERQTIVNQAEHKEEEFSIPLADVNIEKYMLAGLVAGWVIAYFAARRRA